MLPGRAAHYLLCTKNPAAATLRVSSQLPGRRSAWESLPCWGRRGWGRPAAPQPPRWQDSVTQLAGSGALCLLNLQLILLVGRAGSWLSEAV